MIDLPHWGFGGAVIGNLYRPTSDGRAQQCVDAAWDNGFRYFDTAPHYGLGLSERRLGAALAGRPRDEWILSTKVGRLLVTNDNPTGADTDGFAVPDDLRRQWDFSRDGILRSVEESLQRIGTDRIDILYIHDPDDHAEQALREAAPTLCDLRDQGVIRAWGVGMNQTDVPTRFVRETDLDLVMIAGRYTLLDQRAAAELFPECLRRGVGVVNVGVFNSGLLSKPQPAPDAKFDYADAPSELLARTERIARTCKEFDVSLPAAALAFARLHPAVDTVVVGLRDQEQVDSTASMARTDVPAELWTELARQGLIPQSALEDITSVTGADAPRISL